MNTEQKYVGRDSHATTVEQTDKSIKERIEERIAEIQAEIDERDRVNREGRQLMVNALLTLRQWAQDTIVRAEKSRILSASEKSEANQALRNRIDRLTRLIGPEQTGEGVYAESIESAHNWINEWLEEQAHFNEEVRWFELDPYPLPSHIQPKPSTGQGRKLLNAFHNKMSPMIKQSDTLSCTLLNETDTYKKGDVVGVVFHAHKRKVRQFSFGRIEQVNGVSIKLIYDHPDSKQDFIIIPLRMVSFVLHIGYAQSPPTRVK